MRTRLPQPYARSARVPRRRGGLLVALGLAFALSGVLRLGHLDEAWATAAPGTPAVPVAAEGADGATTSGPAMPTETADGLMTALRRAVADAEAVRSRLATREAALDERERTLDAMHALVAAQLQQLEAAEARLANLIAVSDGAADADVDRLTRVYETMDADEAALLFARMDTHFAAGFLMRMSPAASAAVLARVDPDIAYAISVVMATRNAQAPRRGPPDDAVLAPDPTPQN